jgi:hypothetical protein
MKVMMLQHKKQTWSRSYAFLSNKMFHMQTVASERVAHLFETLRKRTHMHVVFNAL